MAARMVVEATEGFDVVGEAETGEDSVTMASDLSPDLVLMDVNLPGINGLDATRRSWRRTRSARSCSCCPRTRRRSTRRAPRSAEPPRTSRSPLRSRSARAGLGRGARRRLSDHATGRLPLSVVPAPGALATSNRPPSASRRSAIPEPGSRRCAAAGSKPTPSSATANTRHAVGPRERDRDARSVRVLRDVLERLEAREVDGRLHILREASEVLALDRDRDR